MGLIIKDGVKKNKKILLNLSKFFFFLMTIINLFSISCFPFNSFLPNLEKIIVFFFFFLFNMLKLEKEKRKKKKPNRTRIDNLLYITFIGLIIKEGVKNKK